MVFLVKNGNKIGIDNNEEMEFSLFDSEDEINVICDNYNFNINDLSILETVNGEKNILQEHIITSFEYDTLIENHYIMYNRVTDCLKVVIYIYDNDFADESLVKFIEKFGRCIEINIDTEEERDILFKQLDEHCKKWSYDSLDDWFESE